MADECCSVGSSRSETKVQAVGGACPTNGKIGKLIDNITLKAILAKPLTELRNVEYRFCKDPDCPTVYYSVDGLQAFTESDLRERVYQKHPQDKDVFVCYCFQYSVGDVLSERQIVVDEINTGIRADQCACDIRNPQGSCCLGNVNRIVKRAEALA
jgi:hypothetical protein